MPSEVNKCKAVFWPSVQANASVFKYDSNQEITKNQTVQRYKNKNVPKKGRKTGALTWVAGDLRPGMGQFSQ